MRQIQEITKKSALVPEMIKTDIYSAHKNSIRGQNRFKI